MVSYAVFGEICVIRMRRTEKRFHIVIILGVLVLVADNEPYRASCRLSVVDAAEELYLVWLVSACRDCTLAWTAAVQLVLYEFLIDVNICWHTINDTADSSSMAFTKYRDRKQCTERVGHVCDNEKLYIFP